MINAALNLVQGAVAQSRPQIIAAQISTTQPAPTSFTDPLYVQNPSQPDNFWQVDDWTVDHGGTLPVQGAACELAYDFTGALRCIWWDGMYSAPSPGGDAGGALSGSFPNPGLSTSTLQTFLQLATAGTLQLALGASTSTFSASNFSANATVTHGIGRTPVFVAAFSTSAAGNVWYSSPSMTTTTVTFIGNYFTTATGTYGFNWIAIG